MIIRYLEISTDMDMGIIMSNQEKQAKEENDGNDPQEVQGPL